MAAREEKDTFDSFLDKYRFYRDYFNANYDMNVTDEIARFDIGPYSGRTLAAVILMLVHNQYKPNAKKLPNIKNASTYDLAKLEEIDIETFDPYIEILRQGKKEKKASKEVSAALRKAKFVATFYRYIQAIGQLEVQVTS